MINADFYRSSHALRSELDLATLRGVDPTDAAQLATARQVLRQAQPVLTRFVKLSEAYRANIDQLAQASDVPAEERAAFASYWEPRLDSLRKLETAMEEALAVVSEFADYLSTVQPSRDGTSGAMTWTAEQRSAIEAFRKRGMEAFNSFQQAARAVCSDCEAGGRW